MSKEVAETVRRSYVVKTIAVNTTFRLCNWADVILANDERWWVTYHAETNGMDAIKVCLEPTRFDDVLILQSSGKDGFDPDPAWIRNGGNSGYSAVHLAAHLGCKRILLCGFDMHGPRWHGRHPEPLRNAGEGIFAGWIARFGTLAPELEKRGIEVVNCTPGSALTCFPMMDLGEALDESRGLSKCAL